MNTKQLTINKDFSKSFFIAKILHRLPHCDKLSIFYNQKRHHYIEKLLNPIFEYSLKRIKNNDHTKNNGSNIIWIFWWQGRNKMTPLTDKCYRSIIKNSGKRKVILITKYNIKKYATIPEYIYQKVEQKKITLTHLSDILRFNLLNNYGGLWVDATIYVTDNLDQFKTNELFTCSGYSIDRAFNISYGRWTGFFIGGPAHLELFDFMDTFFGIYWKYNDKLIDYFLIDFALNYAWNKDLSNFEDITAQNKRKAPKLFELEKNINKEFSEKEWNQIIKNTITFKLSNKKKIKSKNTFYYHLQ